jgi:hypothetical protein
LADPTLRDEFRSVPGEPHARHAWAEL